MKGNNPNIAMLEIVADGLKGLLPEVAFVGGATTSLYIDRPDVEVRPTRDVDCVVNILTYLEQQGLEQKLRKLGFSHCLDRDAPNCRWVYDEIKVDVMPSNASVLGFSNEWFLDGMKHALKVDLPSGKQIGIFSIPYFLAAKISAFRDRGKSDFYTSPDLEDIVTVIDGRMDIRRDIFEAPEEVKQFLKKEFAAFAMNEYFQQSVLGHLAHTEGPQERALRILDILLNTL